MKIRTKHISRKLLAYVLTVAMVFSVLVSVAVSVNAADGYQLVWSDEFDGNGVNPYNWSLDTGVRNGERQTYTIDNAKTQNGKLIIKGDCTVIDSNGNIMPAGEVSGETRDVKSASLQSVGKQAFKFGKVEIRAKLPNACSSWPAFWTCGFDKYGMDRGQGGSSWPCNGEIDFMEMMCVNSENEPKSYWGKTNTDKSYEAHLHTGPKFLKDTDTVWDGDVNASLGYYDFAMDPGGVSDSKQLAADWHTYGMIWEKNSIKITFDGAVKITIDTSNEALLKSAYDKISKGGITTYEQNAYNAYKTMLETYGNPFNDYEHYFLLNFAIGGGGTEYRFYSDEWPQNLAIDYIRVYQKNDGVSTHNATINAGTTYNVNGKTYTTYNHWAGKGLTKGSAIPSNWVADPKYGGAKTEESDTIPTDKPASSTSTSSTSTTTTTTQKPTSGVTIDFDNVTAELEKVGGIAANNASTNSTAINSGKSFKTYAWTGNVSDFTTYYAALNISPHIAENANSLSFKSLAVHDNTGSTALAQYGLTIDGKNYWSGTDTSGVINSTVQTISVVGKTLYATDGTQKTITAVDIPKITKFLVKPTTTETAIYVDDIAIGVDESAASYKITIDGVEQKYSENRFTFPKSTAAGFIAYTDGTNYYDANSTIPVTGNKSFTTVAYGEFTMEKGASIRLKEASGIRFYSPINAEKIAELRQLPNATVDLGTLIGPKDLVEAGLTFDLTKGNYVDVPFKSSIYYTKDDSTQEYVVGSIVNINPCNITRDFVGRGYIKVTLGSVSKTIYADYAGSNIANNARSIAYVANEYKTTAGSGYENLKNPDLIAQIDAWAEQYVEPVVQDELILDWDVTTGYWAEGSTLTTGTDCITAVKASGTNLIGSGNNYDFTAYSGIKFTVTANDGNEKTTLLFKVNDVQVTFDLTNGTTTECVANFADMGLTPTTTCKIYFGATGGTASNITISDLYGIK